MTRLDPADATSAQTEAALNQGFGMATATLAARATKRESCDHPITIRSSEYHHIPTNRHPTMALILYIAAGLFSMAFSRPVPRQTRPARPAPSPPAPSLDAAPPLQNTDPERTPLLADVDADPALAPGLAQEAPEPAPPAREVCSLAPSSRSADPELTPLLADLDAPLTPLARDVAAEPTLAPVQELKGGRGGGGSRAGHGGGGGGGAGAVRPPVALVAAAGVVYALV
jgi:hypothetical protein